MHASQVIGAYRGLHLAAVSSRAYALLLLREFRESKGYEALGYTWEAFCTRELRRPRRSVEEDLQSLDQLGAEFVDLADQIGIGRRALRLLRKLPEEARPKQLPSGQWEIGDRTVDPTDQEELQDAITEIVAEQQRLREEIERGTEQHEELEGKVRELERERKLARDPMKLPEGITELDLYAQHVWSLMRRLLQRVDHEQPDPEHAKRWYLMLSEQLNELCRYAYGLTVPELDPEEFDLEAAEEVRRAFETGNFEGLE